MTTPMTLVERTRRQAELAETDCPFCKSAPVVPTTTVAGDQMLLDAKPERAGTVLITLQSGALIATVMHAAGTRAGYAAQGYAFYTDHKMTCTKSTAWTKPGARSRKAAAPRTARNRKPAATKSATTGTAKAPTKRTRKAPES